MNPILLKKRSFFLLLTLIFSVITPMLIGCVSAQGARIADVEYPEVVIARTEFDVTAKVELLFPAHELGAIAIECYLGEKVIFEDMREFMGSDIITLTYTIVAPPPGEYEYEIDLYIWDWFFEEWLWLEDYTFNQTSEKNKPPKAYAYAVPSPKCAPYTHKFEGWGKDDDGYITKVRWEFGTGTGVFLDKEFSGPPDLGAPNRGLKTEYTYIAAGTYTATFTVWDNALPPLENSATVTFTITDKPIPPTIDAGGPYTGLEGSPINFEATWNLGTCGPGKKIIWSPGSPHTWSDDYKGEVKVKLICDEKCVDTKKAIAEDTADVTVKNVPPQTLAIEHKTGVGAQYEFFKVRVKGKSTWVKVRNFFITQWKSDANPSVFKASRAFVGKGYVTGKPVNFKGSWVDPGIYDSPYTVVFDFGDGKTSTMKHTMKDRRGEVTAPYTYSNAGKYKVTLTVTDKDEGKSEKTTPLPEVVDPNLMAELLGLDRNFKVDKHGILINGGAYLCKGEVRVDGIKLGGSIGVGFEIDLHDGDGYVGFSAGPISIKVKWPPW